MTPSPLSRGAARAGRIVDAALIERLWRLRPVRTALALLGLAMFTLAVITPLDLRSQLVFSGFAIVVALLLRHVPGRGVTIAMVLLSMTVSLRYLYWRLTATIGFTETLDMLFGYGLLLAESYALAVLVLGYMQTIWPLHREPVALPADASTWPSIDVLIPTFNEPLEVVKQSVLTSLSIDWPRDRIRIVVLDDGRRVEFRDFCEQVGVGYLTRDNNRHAKAGNLNHALAHTTGEYVAIFDCDHIPTRSFLQICMGWFLKDPKLAMLQTPHFFFSPDPFEKNLNTFRTVPNEGELFYGLVQDGNDLWNAAFFCGSCAILRRGPLMEVGGIATETVTEDAHTALKLNRRGYNTAYLAVPQAAGLATESLSRHIGQRIRWARGMAQICRVDNPLRGKGLTLVQRFCYLNAMLHFFYGLPRLVFLTAPLAFLFFDAQVFQATALMISAYGLPHLFHANITNSRMQGRFRHSFWNEVYESVLAWYIFRPAMLAVLNPKLGAFNVTAKGGTIAGTYFDWDMARPYIVLLCLNVTGMVVGVGLLIFGSNDVDGIFTICINLLWTLYNIIITSASVAVAKETKQIRTQPRVAAQLPAMIRFPSGKTIACRTSDYSANGLGMTMPEHFPPVAHGTALRISLFRGQEERDFPATAVFSQGNRLGIRFDDLTIQEQIELAEMTFARADTWARVWGQATPDTPWSAFKSVTRIGMVGISQLLRDVAGVIRHRLRPAPAAPHFTITPRGTDD